MKKHLPLILLCITHVHATSFFTKKDVPLPEPISPILFPHGQSLVAPTFNIGISYLGGNVGQLERRVGTSGVLATATASGPSRGKIITAPTEWTNGFQIDFYSSSAGLGSNCFGISYSLLTNSANTSTTTSTSDGLPDILTSFAVNPTTGATDIVKSVSSKYSMPSLQDALFTYSRSLLVSPYLSLLLVGGFHGFYLNHKMSVSYKDSDSNISALSMKESTYGAGPLVGFTTTKKITGNFAFRGSFFASAPLANHSVTQSNSYESAEAATTQSYNAQGGPGLQQHLVCHLDLEAVFRSNYADDAAMEFLIAWHVKQYLNQSYLTSMANNQNASPSTIQEDTLKLSLAFLF